MNHLFSLSLILAARLPILYLVSGNTQVGTTSTYFETITRYKNIKALNNIKDVSRSYSETSKSMYTRPFHKEDVFLRISFSTEHKTSLRARKWLKCRKWYWF